MNPKALLIPDDRKLFDNNIDLLRIIMALMVVYSHSFALFYGSETSETISIITNGFYNSGNIGVWGFFILSGFLITNSFLRSTTIWSYLLKRIRRIYPGYLAATAICAFVVTPLYVTTAYSLDAGEVVRTVAANLVLSNYFPVKDLFANNAVTAVNGSLWSIKFEFLCYVGAALLGGLGLLKKRYLIAIVYLAVVIIWCWLDVTGRKPGGSEVIRDIIGWPYRWFWVLPNFLAGMLVYLYRDALPRSGILLASGSVIIFVAFYSPWMPTVSMIVARLLVPPVLAYVLFWLGFHPGIRIRKGAALGDFSYGTYLYGFVIQQMLMATFVMTFGVFVLLSLASALAAGVASWFLIERHFLPRKSHARSVAPRPDPAPFARGERGQVDGQLPDQVERHAP